MTDRIVYNSEGRVVAQYSDWNDTNFYNEEIGRVALERGQESLKKIEEIAEKHLGEIQAAFRQIREMEMTIQEAILTGVFQAVRESCADANRREAQKQEKIQKFARYLQVAEQNMRHNHFLRLNVFGTEGNLPSEGDDPEWYPVRISGGKGVICDREVSLSATFARLLLVNPYTKIPYPSLQDLLEGFFEARRSRLDFINALLSGIAVQNSGVEVRDYELYSDGVLVFKKEGTALHIYKEGLFRELCQAPEGGKGLLAVIDEAFVADAVGKGHVPKGAERRLRRYIGHTLSDAIHLEAGVYGNLKRVQEIYREEIDDLDGLDRFLYNSIYTICDKKIRKDPAGAEALENTRSLLKCNPQAWDDVKRKYKYLSGNEGMTPAEIARRKWWPVHVGRDHKEPAWDKLEGIYNYLAGKQEGVLLRLSPEIAPDLLRIVKMFDWAISELNCRRAEKEHFERGSYRLRLALLEMRHDFSSFDVFSKTLFAQRLKNVPYLANPKHWFDERVGLQARLVANVHVLARTLSHRMPSFKLLKGKSDAAGIVGLRGNTASGKTSAIGPVPGVLNTDPIKSGLRKGTPVRNKQIHQEGAMLFDKYFKDIESDPDFKYIIDLRFLSVKDLAEFLLEPAKMRQCPVMLKDLDVPLLTSLNRVLKRDPKGDDPIPSLEPIVDGFKKIRENRGEVIKRMIEEEIVKEYYLFYLGKLVAAKNEGEFRIFDQEAYELCIASPSNEKIEQDLSRVIDDNYIEEAIVRGDLSPEERGALLRWRGKSVREAVELHAVNISGQLPAL